MSKVMKFLDAVDVAVVGTVDVGAVARPHCCSFSVN